MSNHKIFKTNESENRSNRSTKLAALIQNIVSDFFTKGEIIDEDGQIMSIIVSKVILTSDLRLAKIFVRWFNKIEFDKENFIKILERNTVNLHKIFAKKIHIKHVPKIKFYYEDSFELTQKLIEHLRNNNILEEGLDKLLGNYK